MVPAGARTPEELETLLEDAFVLRDQEALTQLLEPGAVLHGPGSLQARGREQVIRFLMEMWNQQRTYVADPQSVLQAQDTALILDGRAINVVRRGDDGSWRYAVLFLFPDMATASPGSVQGATARSSVSRDKGPLPVGQPASPKVCVFPRAPRPWAYSTDSTPS